MYKQNTILFITIIYRYIDTPRSLYNEPDLRKEQEGYFRRIGSGRIFYAVVVDYGLFVPLMAIMHFSRLHCCYSLI